MLISLQDAIHVALYLYQARQAITLMACALLVGWDQILRERGCQGVLVIREKRHSLLFRDRAKEVVIMSLAQ